jgi:aryl-alcohol dehydrogenase-like predicted oxidoreductase
MKGMSLMKYKPLGRTGVLVSELCLGTMTFGVETDEAESARMFAKCRDAGVNFFDCANNYGGGKAEQILGKLIKGCRDEVIITTKVSQRIGKDVNALGGSRRHIMLAVEQSLARLQTDRIDLYIVHYFDPLAAMDETLRALDDLVSQGKVLYLGVSNWAAWQIATALGVSARHNWRRFECIQLMYNLVKRQAEVELLPLAEAENMGVIPYNPLAAGLLSGKYFQGAKPAGARIVEKRQYNMRYSEPIYYETADKFVAYAREQGINPVTLAVSWVKSHPAVTAPIIGARNADQLTASLAAADLDLDTAARAAVTALSISPANATDRLEEEMDESQRFRNRK